MEDFDQSIFCGSTIVPKLQIQTLAGAKSGCKEEVCEQDEKHCKCRQSGPEVGGENTFTFPFPSPRLVSQ